jgi:hypothetical protein
LITLFCTTLPQLHPSLVGRRSRHVLRQANKMTSRIEFLPTEICDLIFSYLDDTGVYPTVTSLLQCCHRLRGRLEPWLYGESHDAVTRALRRGCRAGSPQTVRLAVKYGAPVNVSIERGR